MLVSVSSKVAAGAYSPSSDSDGAFTVSWDSGYLSPQVTEYKNGVYQRVISPAANATSVSISGRTDGVWKYVVRGENISGGGGGEPLWVFVEKIKRNPLFFLVGSAHAGIMTTIGTTETEVLRKPGKPGGLTLPSSDKNGSYTVSWGAASGSLDRYELRERKDGGSWSRVYNGSSISASISGRGTGIYEYRVRACNDSSQTTLVSCGSYTSINSMTVIRTPGSITVPPSSSNGSVAVSWSSVSGAASYVLQEQKDSGAWSQVYAGTSTGKTVTGRSNGIYRYRIAAVENGYTGGYRYSSYVTVSKAPGVPTGFTVPTSSSSGSYTVSWDPVSGAEHYNLEQDGEAQASWSPTATSKSFAKTKNGTYSYRVRACSIYNSVESCGGWTSQKTLQLALPGLFVKSVTNAGDVTLLFNVDWPTAESCELKRDGQVISTGIMTAGSTFNDSVSSSGTYGYSYTCQRCLPGAGSFPNCTDSEPVGYIEASAIVVFPPGTPSLSLTPANSIDGIVYLESSSSGPVSSVRWQKKAVGNSWPAEGTYDTASTTTGQFQVSNLSSGDWELRSKNCNGEGCSATWSNTASVSVQLKPKGDFSFNIGGSQSEGELVIQWSADSELVDNYFAREKVGDDWGEWQDLGVLREYPTDPKPDGNFQYEVYACNGSGCSDPIISQVVTINHPIPKAPINLTTSRVDQIINLSWSKAETGGYDDIYQFRLNGEAWQRAATPETAQQGVGGYGSYTFKVRSCNLTPGDDKCSESATATYEVIDPDPASPKWAKLLGDLGILDSGLGDLQPTQHQPGVGAIEGVGSVDGGVASYRIPVALPPGRNGLQPQLSLSYSSRAGNGVLGKGWSLNAGSQISRCPQTRAQDGQAIPVQYLSSDRLCLDGQRLIAVSGSYGASGTIYRTETDTFMRVTQSGGINGTSTWFKAELKNGRIRYYGFDSGSRHSAMGVSAIYSWALTREEDRTVEKNSINYVYQSFGDGEHQLKEINYTGSQYANGDRKAVFVYESTPRPDISSRYLAGGLTRQTSRLDKLEIYYQAELLREYRFDYKLSRASNASLMTSLLLCDRQGDCLSPTALSWADKPEVKQQEILGAAEFSGGNYFNANKSVTPLFPEEKYIDRLVPRGDFNGDGVRDWPGYFVSAEGEQTGTFPAETEGCLINPFSGSIQCVEVDINNDGLTDTWRRNNDVLEVGTNINDGIFNWKTTPVSLPVNDRPVNSGDYNGDGWVDLIIRRGDRYSDNYLYLYLHTGNPASPYANDGELLKTFSFITDGEGGGYFSSSVQFVGDIDGNGLPDLMESSTTMSLPTNGIVSSPQETPTFFLYAVANGSGVSFVRVSTDTPQTLVGGVDLYFYYLIDINGDGLSDWINWRGNQAGVYYRLNQGGGDFTSWAYAGADGSLPGRLYRYYKKGDSSYDFYYGLKYVSAIKQFDRGADGKMELIFPGQALVEGCQRLYDGGVAKDFCGDEIYGEVNAGTDSNKNYQMIEVTKNDVSLYSFSGLQFTEQPDGSFKAERFTPNIVGTPYSSAVIDAFGNGLADFVYYYGCVYYPGQCSVPDDYGHTTGVYVQRNRGAVSAGELYEPTDMLIAVENGFGQRDEWHYRPLSSRDDRYHTGTKPFYERGGYLEALKDVFPTAYDEHFEFTSSMYVVAEHRRSNGVGGLNVKQYRYKGAVFNSHGRGFQGFHTIIEEDLAANIETQSDFHQIFPLAGKLHRQRKWELGDRSADTAEVDAFQESSFEWQFWPKGGHFSPIIISSLTDNWSVAANEPYFVGLYERSTVHRTLGSLAIPRRELYTKTESSFYDQWGNVVAATNRYEEASSSHIVTSSTNTQYVTANTASWEINRLLKQTATKEAVQSRAGVNVDPGTDVQQSIVVDYLLWDENARKPKQVRTTPSDGKWKQVDTEYNSYGLPQKVTTSAEGEAETRFVETTAFSSDNYFPKTVKNAFGHTVTTVANPKFGKPDSVTDANGLTTDYEYDAFGRVITVTAPSALGLKAAPDTHTAMQWCNPSCISAPGAVYKTIQQQAGTPTAISYHDELGRVIRTEVQAFDGTDWVVQRKEFNALGQVTFESVPHYASSPNSYGTRYDGYDTFGRALGKTVDQTDGQVLDIDYTHEQGIRGFTTNIVVNNRQMSRTYNGLQQLTETVDALSGSTRYAYDGAGNPIVLQGALANRITAKYNALGLKEWVDDPNMGFKSFTYTGFGEVESETDANLDVISYTYDRLGRMDTRSVNGIEEASWVYDSTANGVGMLSSESRSDASYARSYRYDALSRPDQITTTIDSEDFVTVNHYDSNYGRLKGLSYPSGLTVKYSYNSAGYRFRTSNAASGYTYREITQMDAWGEWEFANVAAGNYIVGRAFHAETGQMSGSAFDSLVQTHQMLSYDYDTFGNLWQKTVDVPSESPSMNVENHYYDALNRLDYSTRTDGPTIDYDYDAIGNLLKKDDFASSYSYIGGASGGPSAVKSATLVGGGTVTYGYDQNGNRTHEGGSQQVWYNAFNKPTHISRNGADLYFSYGADQMRYKQVNQATGKATIYIDKLFERISGAGEAKYRHFIGDIAVVTTTDNGTDLSHEIGFTHRDRLGSTVAIGDESGNLLETHSFDPFGKPRQGNVLDKTVAQLESSFTTRGFTDHEHLDDVELIHMNGRAYDYNLGRFLSVDPIIQAPGNSQSLNPYSYIMNNPLAGTDPTGYASCSMEDPGSCNDVANDLGKDETADITQKQAVTGSRIKRDVKVGTITGNGNGTVSVKTGVGSFTASTDIGGQSSRANTAGSGQIGQSGSGAPDSGGEEAKIGLCGTAGKCRPKDYSAEEQTSILERTNRVTADIRSASYDSVQAAAVALHENEELMAMAEEYGVEFWAVIDKKTFRIKEVATGFHSGKAEGMYSNSFKIGDSVWHTHPSGKKVWKGDLHSVVGKHGRWVFASGRKLSGIDSYTTGYTRTSQINADYGRGNVTRHLYSGGEWSTEQYRF